jgi:hypothetical protein
VEPDQDSAPGWTYRLDGRVNNLGAISLKIELAIQTM